ncbi:uncharacterized protein A1O9_01571 [Exophiala aquamarina CBS 119918]|uniref:DUF1275 domain protein n=1 Tax=Exophiala aquamarina CBS 119918 TaxID=1182545 RepID=A0A072PW45_9EURO|nr:uncharacterized protein A1O9_01571 [Exophiala aquamarina CBS 119918]KEF63593.1 hypothetical protein A1O9_01571 [Exophiala aquamarina CBS 119918]
METLESNLEKDGTVNPGSESPRPSMPLSLRLKSRLTSEVEPKWADAILLGCFFVAGVVDSVAFNKYTCFVSMQTGNTIFLGLGVSDLPVHSPKHTWVKSLVAISSFCLGSLSFSRYHLYLGALKRWVIMSSFAIQTMFMIITSVLVSSGVAATGSQDNIPRKPGDRGRFQWVELCPIALLAFQSAGQIVASRVLKYNSMPTLVLTSVYCDLMSDPNLFTAGLFEDPDRNRRAASVTTLFVGAVVGGALSKSSVGYPVALWIATGLKACMVIAWFLWKRK